jgi:hypothetical protein
MLKALREWMICVWYALPDILVAIVFLVLLFIFLLKMAEDKRWERFEGKQSISELVWMVWLLKSELSELEKKLLLHLSIQCCVQYVLQVYWDRAEAAAAALGDALHESCAERDALRAELTELRAALQGATCTVCLVRPAQIAAVPCGHRFLCTSCDTGPDWRCYVCRMPMTGTLRVF